MTYTIFYQIIHAHYYIKIFYFIYVSIIYFTYAVSEWWQFLSVTSLFFLSVSLEAVSAPAPVIVTVPKYVRITVIKKSWLQLCSFDLILIVCVVYYTCIIIHSNPVSCSEFWWLIISVVEQICDFVILLLDMFMILMIKVHW